MDQDLIQYICYLEILSFGKTKLITTSTSFQRNLKILKIAAVNLTLEIDCWTCIDGTNKFLLYYKRTTFFI